MSNEEFKVVKYPEHFVSGEVKFPVGFTHASEDGTYKMVFGPSISTSTKIYGNSDDNISVGMRRMLAARKGSLLYHRILQGNQRKFIFEHIEQFIDLKMLYERYLLDYKGAEMEASLHHADPHIKRLLRIAAWIAGQYCGWVFDPNHPWLKSVVCKMKKGEYGKPGKKPRMIMDFGTLASLRGFILAELFKIAQDAEPYSYLGGTIFFCKRPDPFRLTNVFRELIEPSGRYTFVYFSDDSCFSLRVGAKVLYFNLDISSCDASHTTTLFSVLKLLSPESMRRDMDVLLKQCSMPLKIRCVKNPHLKVKLKPVGHKLYSGSTITTLINNTAGQCIGMSLAEMDYQGPHSIVAAGERAGYILTGVDPVEDYSQLQFLKHSPIYDINGDLRPLFNISVVLRSSGTCAGDLPGRGCLKDRAKIFQRSILNSAYPRVNHPIVKALGVQCGVGPVLQVKEFQYKVCPDELYPVFTVSAEEAGRRYGLSGSQIEQEAYMLSLCGYGNEYTSEALERMFLVDYQYQPPKRVAKPVVQPYLDTYLI